MNGNLMKQARLFLFAFLTTAFFSAGVYSQKNERSSNENKTQKSVPYFEPSPCAVQPPEGIKSECGNLFVKENRSKPESRTIKLSFIIIKSTAENPAPDPVFYTGGGPGASSLGRAGGAKNLAPYTKNRDFIIFEQRGTRYAEPSLQCPEVETANHTSAEKNLSEKESLKNEVQAAKVCHDRLLREGVDLSAYNSAESAADIEDLRRVLKIEKWNLYGVSYSTRLMLNYIREYPKSVRSVILDSVLPPTVNWDETGVDGVMRSLNFLFEQCADDKECSAAYPKLEEKFYSLLESANKKPIIINVSKDGKNYPVKLDGNAIFDFVYNLLEDTGALADIPWIINALAQGNYEPLNRYAENKITGGGFIRGMRYSVWCREEMPFQDRRKIAAQATKYAEIKGFKIQGAFPEICKIWNIPAAGEIENKPVKSDIPALIFSGEYDPDTTPAWGKLVSSWFPNSFFYAVKNTSHGVLFGNRCSIVEIVPSFLDNPTAKPKDSCLAEIPPLDFK